MIKTYIENYIEEISYESIGNWRLPDTSMFSHNKKLFKYQEDAIKNAGKVLYSYFNSKNGKEKIYSKCMDLGMEGDIFDVHQFSRPIDEKRGLNNNRYLLLQNYYQTTIENGKKLIKGYNFFNRMAFWMATGSGKSIVLIKMIEYLSYLQSQDLIPKKDILLLIPRDDLIAQINKEINEYNLYREKQIELVNLRDYEEDKNNLTLLNNIKVYYYRSDLIRDERKETILDFKDYDNDGNWYILLDEAHRGETGVSLMQDYLSILSRNGYLFNFSATFTDPIDYVTTCYNFNLEKFINAGYGKNIYLSKSYFDFKNKKDDFSDREKQKQVLKSIIILAAIKKTKKEDIYHAPLLVTLVNSINTDESDLLMFFEKIEEIASGNISKELFIETKNELEKDLNHDTYVLGNERFKCDSDFIKNTSLEDVLYNVFNTKTNGKIEILEGEKGKEIILKLETSERPFALIKIGDADKFQREKLGDGYTLVTGYKNRNYFKNINNDSNINMLLGSRSFYEGWDSNRPNVINYINIGGKDAKKYVLQSLGRGIRIEPRKDVRNRLDYTDEDKNILMETLFVFATDKKGVLSVLETMDEQKYTDEYKIELDKNEEIKFDLLIPEFKDADNRDEISYFYVSKENIDNFKKYFYSFDENVLLIKKGITRENYKFILDKIESNELFRVDNKRHYVNYDLLMDNVINHVSFKNKVVGNIKKLEDEIIHFKHLKVIRGTKDTNLDYDDIIALKEKINQVKRFKKIDKKQLALDFANELINEKEFKELMNSKPKEQFKDLIILKLTNHYYFPLVYSENEKVNYIKNIIKTESEVKFINNLAKYIEEEDVKNDWMFSRVNENIDSFYIPYFLRSENRYSKFYPDFIFWLKNKDDYKIVFVDPKGTAHASYINKIEEFKRIFFEKDTPKIYKYKNFNITFHLKLIGEDINKVPLEYQKFWLSEEDFSFLKI